MTVKRGRPRNKEYDPKAVLSKIIGSVREVYDNTGEIKATADELDLATLKVKKLLITAGKIR